MAFASDLRGTRMGTLELRSHPDPPAHALPSCARARAPSAAPAHTVSLKGSELYTRKPDVVPQAKQP